MPASRSLLLSVLVILVAGCGGESDEAVVERTLKTYHAATDAGDVERACAQVTENFASGRSCREIVEFNHSNSVDGQRSLADGDYEVTVDGDTAVARGQNLGTFTFRKVDGGWKLDGVRG